VRARCASLWLRKRQGGGRWLTFRERSSTARRAQARSGALDSKGSKGSGALDSKGSKGSGALDSKGSKGSGALDSKGSKGSGLQSPPRASIRNLCAPSRVNNLYAPSLASGFVRTFHPALAIQRGVTHGCSGAAAPSPPAASQPSAPAAPAPAAPAAPATAPPPPAAPCELLGQRCPPLPARCLPADGRASESKYRPASESMYRPASVSSVASGGHRLPAGGAAASSTAAPGSSKPAAPPPPPPARGQRPAQAPRARWRRCELNGLPRELGRPG